jgi:SpoVK/Ycf46/Vps4 family AAA+-type ATPase
MITRMIYQYQTEVFQGLQKAMAVHHYAQGLQLPIKPRTHTLIIGPTGAGKTHVVNTAIKSANWGIYHINCSAWMVNGSRGDSHTIQDLVAWVAREPVDRPLTVFLDEIDKVGNTTTDWYRNVVSEMLSLLDGHLQPGSYDLDGKDGNEVERRFKTLFIVGSGAFQAMEDGPQSGMGFNPEDKTGRSLDKLSNMLPRELTNRFSDKILRLPRLELEDYREIARVLYRAAPADVRPIIKSIAPGKIESAVENHTGARFGETLAAEVIEAIIVGQEPQPWVEPKKEESVEIDDTEDLWDMEIDS